MSSKVTSAVWNKSNASGSDRLVLLAIADRCNDKGDADISVVRIAEACRLSERAVRYSIKALMQSGELSMEPNAGPKRSNAYTINISLLGGCNPCRVQTVQDAIRAPSKQTNSPKNEAKMPLALKVPVNGLTVNGLTDSQITTEERTTEQTNGFVVSESSDRGEYEGGKPKPLPLNGESQQFVAAFCKVAGLERPAVYGKAVGQATMLLKAGVRIEDIPALYEFSSWGDGSDLGRMLNAVDRWRSIKPAKPKPLHTFSKGGAGTDEFWERSRQLKEQGL